jgi:hypothetical protein
VLDVAMYPQQSKLTHLDHFSVAEEKRALIYMFFARLPSLKHANFSSRAKTKKSEVGQKERGRSRRVTRIVTVLNNVFYSPQLCMAVWWGASFLCFSFFLVVRLNLLIFTVASSMEAQ